MLQLGLADNCFEAIYVQLAMMPSVFHAYNACSQLVISINDNYVCRESKQGRLRKLAWQIRSSLTAWKPKAFHQLNHTYHSAAQDQQYKIILHAKHKLRAPLICSCTIKQNSCNISIQFGLICKCFALALHPWALHLQIRYKPHACVITITYIQRSCNTWFLDIRISTCLYTPKVFCIRYHHFCKIRVYRFRNPNILIQ